VAQDPVVRFEALFRAAYPAVRRYAFHRGVTGADADDLAAETFVVAWRRLDAVPHDDPVPWLLRVAANIQRNRARSGRRYEAMVGRLPVPVSGLPPSETADIGHAVLDAMESLGDDDQEILRLVAWDGLTPQEAAGVLGTSGGVARLRLHRARKRLAALLADRPAPKRAHARGQFDDDGKELSYEPAPKF
jgi:RNA polymerase sigma-70 factor (ECF subfamily)